MLLLPQVQQCLSVIFLWVSCTSNKILVKANSWALTRSPGYLTELWKVISQYDFSRFTADFHLLWICVWLLLKTHRFLHHHHQSDTGIHDTAFTLGQIYTISFLSLTCAGMCYEQCAGGWFLLWAVAPEGFDHASCKWQSLKNPGPVWGHGVLLLPSLLEDFGTAAQLLLAHWILSQFHKKQELLFGCFPSISKKIPGKAHPVRRNARSCGSVLCLLDLPPFSLRDEILYLLCLHNYRFFTCTLPFQVRSESSDHTDLVVLLQWP